MFEKLLNFGRVFDWITPSAALLQDLINGHPRDFGIPANSYWGIREIRQLLGYYNIRVWGLMYELSGEVLRFSVHKDQADLTYTILQQEGIPILYAPKGNTRRFLTAIRF